jgi:hypothetical protein
VLPFLVTRAQARRAGLSDRQITWRITHGQWQVLRRNVFVVPRPAVAPLGGEDRRLVAALAATRREVVVGHAHAARLWGLPCPLGGWGDPVLLASDGPHRARNGTRIVVTPLPASDVVRHRGVLVTSPERTVTDCLRVLQPVDALAIADAAARRLVAAATLAAAVDRLGGWPGVVRARRLVGLVDGRRESAFESWSALAFATTGLFMPLWQVDVGDSAGFVGRGDAWWDDGVVGEADGKAKYRLRAAERGGVDAARLAQVLDAERRREQRMRRAGLTVVRWEAKDVLDPSAATALTAHLRSELALRAGRTFTATVTPHPFRHPA